MIVCFPSTSDEDEDTSYRNAKAFCTGIKTALNLRKWKRKGGSLNDGDMTEVNSRVLPSFKHD